MKEKERIISLSNAFGPSGFEDEVLEVIKKELKEYEVEEDKIRNLVIEKDKGSKNPRVMLDAHTDEVGLIVQAIKPNGTIRFINIGGISKASVVGNSYVVKTKDGSYVQGVVAVKPPHFTKKNEVPSYELEDMVLDVGTTSKEETEALGIGIGSAIVANVSCTYDNKQDLFFGKAFDDRIGVAVLIEVMKRLKKEKLDVNVCASFSSQEEVGERGVSASTKRINPDVLICIEGCPADDTFQEEYMIQAGIKRGPMLRHMDTSMITNPRFQKYALDTAKKKKIKVQEAVRSGGGTNAAMVNQSFGVPAIVVSVPVRYIHSSYCFVAMKDYEDTVKLVIELIKGLDKKVIEAF